MPHASNDPLIIEALTTGYFTTNSETGWVLRHGQPCGYVAPSGYVSVPYRTASLRAHRVIYIAAHGPIDPQLVINHKNDHKWDNRLINLEAITHHQNIIHAWRPMPHGHDRAGMSVRPSRRRGSIYIGDRE